MTISRYDIPLIGWHVLTNPVDGRPVEGRIVAVATYPAMGGETLPVWVEARPWPRHELVVRVVVDGDPYDPLDGWEHAGTARADGGTVPALHVLWQRRRRTETEASDA